MKYAVIGNGKTGSRVQAQLDSLGAENEVFDSENKPTSKRLASFGVGICYVNVDTFTSLSPLMIESKIPLVIGTTGFEWDSNTFTLVKDNECKWIKSANFSIGINLINNFLKKSFNDSGSKLLDYEISIHEKHHENKKDAPSGTALHFSKLIDREAKISFERKNDIVGFHSFKMETEDESITIVHDAKNRNLFARGAVLATHYIDTLDYGIHDFEEIINQ